MEVEVVVCMRLFVLFLYKRIGGEEEIIKDIREEMIKGRHIVCCSTTPCNKKKQPARWYK